MRRKSIGATSQAFHEPMSTGAFLEFLTRLGCRDAGQQVSCNCKAPPSETIQGLGPGPPGLGARPTRSLGPFPQKPPFSQTGGSLAKAWVSAETAASEVGTWRETQPGYAPYAPPPHPSPPSATIQHAPQGRRTLNP